MQRRRPEYNPDDLRRGIEMLDVNIDRLQKAIGELRQRNDSLRQSIERNNKDVQIFTVEIGKLENQKNELQRLITQIEKKG